MLNIDILRSRFIRLLGNIIKLISVIFHKIFPNKRFTIPSYKKPLINSKRKLNVPRIIWQTNFTNKVTLPIYANYLFNRFMAPRYEYKFMNDEAAKQYIAVNHPEIIDYYKKLAVGAAKADLWRLLVLYKCGGIYMDMDGCLVKRPENFLKGKDEIFIKAKAKQLYFTNYFLATIANNSKIKKYIETIIENIQKGDTSIGVWYLTGPGIMEKIMNNQNTQWQHSNQICVQGAFTNKHFQYIDKPNSLWTKIDNKDILKPH